MRKSRMNFGQALERGPRWSFRDGDIGIAGDQRFAMRGVDDADGEARGHQRKERCDFLFSERMRAMVRAQNGGSSGERIVVPKDRVGGGDGRFGNGDGLVHVAKVDHGDNLSRLRPRRRDESVVVVGIAIDDAATKLRNARQGFAFEQVEEIRGQRAALWALDVWEKFTSPERTSQIPLQVALGEGMRKIEERDIDFSEQTAEALEEFERMRICLGKDCAGKKC